MSKTKRYTITAALPYANGPLHLGHIAGAYLPADIYVRYLKSQRHDVAFICGSDEHGAAITLRAKKEGKTPQQIVDENHQIIKKAFTDFGIDFSIYHRTSSPIHHETAAGFFKDLNDKNAFTQETSEQFYDEKEQQFLADRYIIGTCPKCNYDNAYGDQCEKCGSTLSPTDLINPKSAISGNTPILKETSHWYLPMNKHEDWLRKWLEEGKLDNQFHHDPKLWKKNVLGQCKSWIDNGLQARSITRDLDWGVKVPIEGAEGKVLYVWFDAPIGYISATKAWAEQNGKNWEDYWKKEDTELIHFIGKDNIVFHAIIFPIILKAHGDYILPTNVPANEFLNLEGDKISTSRNWAVWLHEYLADFPGRQDELRYVLTSIAPETKDSEFTWKDYQARVNNELVAIFGNFVNRTVVLTHKYFNGLTPLLNNCDEIDNEVLAAIPKAKAKVNELITQFKFRDAQTEAMTLARIGNKYLADTEPWKLIKTDEERVKTILNISLQICDALSDIFLPFLPQTCCNLKNILNLKSDETISTQHQIGEATLLFQKIEDDLIEAQIKKLKESNKKQSNPKANPMKDEITFDDFTKMDIRTGTILTAEKHPDADKLLKMTVDTGIDVRTIVSGIAEHYAPEEIIGKQVSVLINLAPRKIRGIVSQGMILMAEDNEGNLAFVSPEKTLDNGGEIR
ncbi:MAG: methionine--tRNA ligase [Flavobacteriales bacterium]|nr:methionine--tRNA ligase [Flavobacteriales bacterium]MBQ20870.1 methionine--tRNA ligase [Flavobacteriales bacterium]|tara:strand:+ start:64974 stop:67016 length:2043 start_codon:yes stop_codon:yes gene_type:complete